MRTAMLVRSWSRVALVGSLALLVLGVLLLRDSMGSAVSASLSPLETRVFGESRWLLGGPAALRVIVTDHRSGKAVDARVTITLAPLANGKPVEHATKRLFSGNTNRAGTIDASFTVPEGDPGAYRLTVGVDSALGRDEVLSDIQLDESAQVLLTCDKPLYQPGQTIHLRALVLDLATREAVADTQITFEVEDARANKVFKQRETLDEFGLAAVDFTLADEVNMGTFTLRATLPRGSAEKKVRVERYVLPKFKTALTTDRAYYQPGDTVKGTVQADYFFGKPVAGGAVTVTISTLDIGVTQLAELKGATDANGAYQFEYTLPDHFVGQSFEQGKAVVEFHGQITDTADHAQDVYTSRPVVKDPILIAVVPECRELVPGVDNGIYLAVATPDGQPLTHVPVHVTIPGGKDPFAFDLTTDDFGMAMVRFTPTALSTTITVTANTADGKTATVSQPLAMSGATEGIILRTTKSLAKVGDRVTVTAVSTQKSGAIYLDIIRNKQTILTKALETRNGYAAMILNITHDMTGTLELRAYKILPNEEIIRDSQVMVVQPADDLTVTMESDKTEYRPGEDAKLTFSVHNQRQQPVMAALGLAIVDESVFALSELQPGLEKVYFTLEKELMEPKYEIHGLTPVGLLLNPGMPIGRPLPVHDPVLLDGERQRAASMLLAGAPATDFGIHVNTYQQRWEKMREDVTNEMMKAHRTITTALQRYRAKHNAPLTATEGLFSLVREGYLKMSDLKDRWGTFYKTDLHGAQNYDTWFTISSAGPDRRWGTSDDITEVTAFDGRHWGRGINGPMVLEDVDMAVNLAPMPMAMPAGAGGAMKMARGRADDAVTDEGANASGGAAEEPVRVREYFPETMYWNPLLLTDQRGEATITVPLADSITSWRLSMFASSIHGQLGSATAPLKVFQDFFVDLDLPLTLTQHDRVEIPVAVYNYLPETQTVRLTLDLEPWFTLDGNPEQSVEIGKNQVKVVYFPITVTDIGRHTLTVTARGTKLSDAIRRAIDVVPDGKEYRTAINDRLDGKVEKSVEIPAEAIDGGSNVWVKLYPGTFSQVVDGLDGLLRMPNGCFEQTSSSTYPNVLILDYLKQVKKVNPEIRMKAEQYINVGYQRLVTFECKSGGFSWFGNEPAHQVLTAYGLLEFSDMSRVHDVDAALLQRTQQWLASKQNADGSWEEKGQGIAEGIINRQTGALRTTAYIAWALAESGYAGPALTKGVAYLKAHDGDAKDPYTLAVLLNLFTRTDKDAEVTAQLAHKLLGIAKQTDKSLYWQSDMPSFTGAQDVGADLETTGLAAYGLVKWGRETALTTKVLTYLIQNKNSFGAWSSTQGTVWSLKALIRASSTAFGGGKGTVTVHANGQTAATFAITEENNDVMRQVDVTQYLKKGANDVTLEYQGEGALTYQIVGRYYIPWAQVVQQPQEAEPLHITVAYDKTKLSTTDSAIVTITVKNQTEARVEMPLIDLGVAPGFTVNPAALDQAVADKKISKYTLAARQIIVYIEKLDPKQEVTLSYQIIAKYPIRARTPSSSAYPYYNPEKAAVSAPQNVVVTK